MKQKKWVLTFIIVLTIAKAFSNTGRYRLTLRDDPSSSIVIGWDQFSGNNPIVYYDTIDHGTNWSDYSNYKQPDKVISYKGMNNHFARLSGLQPNTNYYFVIRDSQGTSSRYWFKTSSDNPNDRLSFIAGGDSRNNFTPRQNANKLVAKLKPNAVLFGGDMISSGTNSEWQNWFDHWQLTIANDGRMFPIVAARGNHESSNSMIQNLFDVPNSNVYYAITFGGSLVRTYTLNTEISITGNQSNWLVNDLQSSNTIWKMAQYHKPMRPHVSSKSEGNNQYNNWSQAFYDYGVRLVVECDAHTVKTTWPLKPSTESGSEEGFIRDDQSGTVYAGEGCWGAPLRTNNDNKQWTRNSGKFNQFKWIFVDQHKIELRTIKVDNADQVEEVANNQRFEIPNQLDVWQPSNGEVVTITNSGKAPTCMINSPSNTQQFSGPESVIIEVDANDEDGSVEQVQFFVNGTPVGSDFSSPYTLTHFLSENGSYDLSAEAIDNDGNRTTSSTVTVYVGSVVQSIAVKIVSGEDDVEEKESNGEVYDNSSDLELVYDGYNNQGNQTVGLRFQSVNVPNSATITNAYIQFTADETNGDSANLTIRGEDVNDSAVFSNSNYNVSSRMTTSAKVSWNPPSWNSVGASGQTEATPNLKSIVQEIINRQGWSANQSMTFIITGTGKRTAESYNGSSSKAAVLNIEYVVGLNQAPNCQLLNPTDGTELNVNQTLKFNANANDSDGTVESVEFFVDGFSIGSVSIAPYSLDFQFDMDGEYECYAEATDNRGNKGRSASHFVSVNQSGSTQSITIPIIDGNDDVEENESTGEVYNNSSDIELVYDNYNNQGNQTVGLRFQSVNIPNAATITNAYIQFTADETSSTSANIMIRGEATDQSTAFSSNQHDVSNRNTTSAFVNWNPPAWNIVGASSENEATPNLQSIVQEIVTRSGWNASNHMTFILTGTGKRTAESYNGSISKSAKLHVEYIIPSFQETELTLYPNPFSNELLVSLNPYQGQSTIYVYDSNLKLIKTIKANNKKRINLRKERKGLYHIVVKTDQKFYYKTVFKQ